MYTEIKMLAKAIEELYPGDAVIVETTDKGTIVRKATTADTKPPEKKQIEGSLLNLEPNIPIENIRLFEFATSAIKELNKDAQCFQMPKKADTKRIAKAVQYIIELQTGVFEEKNEIDKFTKDNIDSNLISSFKGMAWEDVLDYFEMAMVRFAKAKQEKDCFKPFGPNFKPSFDEFIYNYNEKTNVRGRSLFLYYVEHELEIKKVANQYNKDLIKEVYSFMEKLYGKAYLSWEEEDKLIFIKNYAELTNWYFKNKELLCKDNSFQQHCGSFDNFLKMFVRWMKDGGWFQIPHLPRPYEDNRPFKKFREWLNKWYHITILYEEPEEEIPEEIIDEVVDEYVDNILKNTWE